MIEIDDMRRAIGLFRDTRSYLQLTRVLKQLKPDVVHTHSSKAGIMGRWAAHRTGVPVILHTIHGLAFTASSNAAVNGVYRLAEKLTAPISTRIIGVADAMVEQSLAGGVGRREQYVTVYSGMETAPFLSPPVSRDEVRMSLGIGPEHVVAGTIARLFDLKGHDDLLAVAPELCSKYPQLRFMWVGDGSLRDRFQRQVRDMGLADRFIMTGLVPPTRIAELVGAMDIVVHPSRREGLARALAQGALAAKPVITYDIDGNREALQADITGYLLEPFKVAQLQRALVNLLDDPAKRQYMGRSGPPICSGTF